MKKILKSKLFLFISLASLLLFLFFESKVLEIPLLSGHAIKTACNVEVAYNLARYNDFFSLYTDYNSTVYEMRGRYGNIIGADAPLSSIILGLIYKFDKNSVNLDHRIMIPRYTSLIQVVLSYLIICIFIFKKNFFGWVIFALFYLFSNILLYQSTRPMSETALFFYQAVFLISIYKLSKSNIKAAYKTLGVFGLVLMLCFLGKMNYFLVATPTVIAFPFLVFNNKKEIINYFKLLGLLGLTCLALILLSKFDLKLHLRFFIKGNYDLTNNSLFLTFFEGFRKIDDVAYQALKDFGVLPTIFAISYLVAFFLTTKLKKIKNKLNFDIFIVLLVLGHATNYLVLRNLYVPHNYYIFPLFQLFALLSALLIYRLVCEISKTKFSTFKYSYICLLIGIILFSANNSYKSYLLYKSSLVEKDFLITMLSGINKAKTLIPKDQHIISNNYTVPFYLERNNVTPNINELELYRKNNIHYYVATTWDQPSDSFKPYLEKIMGENHIFVYKINYPEVKPVKPKK